MTHQLFQCGTLYTPTPETRKTCIFVQGGTITDLLTPEAARDVMDAERIDLGQAVVGPGLVDIHCHGAKGSDFADGTEADVRAAAEFHLAQGTTTLLAGIGSCTAEEMLQACTTVRALHSDVPNLAGVHLEGPYFNIDRYGCHLREMIRSPDRQEWTRFAPHQDVIRLVTLAPELPGALEFIREFSERGTVFSLGHSCATYEQICRACDAGLTHSTHLFCATTTASRVDLVLQPGTVETVLMLDRLSTEIIGDGIHVGPRMVEYAHKVKGTSGLALVSDALRGVGCPPGDYAFGPRNGQKCRLLDSPRVGVVPDRPGILASSGIVLADALRVLSRSTRLSLSTLWEMASLTPARILRLDRTKGALVPGRDADLLALHPDLSVAAVYVGGVRRA